MAVNNKVNFIAVIIWCIIITIPIVLSSLLLGKIFWTIILIVGGCLVSIPFFALLGFARSGSPVSPNQLLSRIMHPLKASEPKIIDRITLADIIKGIIFSIVLVLLYFITLAIYGFFIDMAL